MTTNGRGEALADLVEMEFDSCFDASAYDEELSRRGDAFRRIIRLLCEATVAGADGVAVSIKIADIANEPAWSSKGPWTPLPLPVPPMRSYPPPPPMVQLSRNSFPERIPGTER